MATSFTRVLFGLMRDVSLAKFNAGFLANAVSKDLVEFGERGVQGLIIKGSDAVTLVQKHAKAPNAADLFCIVGVAKGNLVFVIHDKKNPAWEAGPVTVVKDYEKIHRDLAANSAKVADITPTGRDRVIVGAAAAQGNKFDSEVTTTGLGEELDLGGITGNVVLCAHGAPKVVPGRVIGVKFGRKTPAEVVDILIGNPDPAKRLARDYRGKVTLSGCFTSSGGPEEDRQDDPFAKQVHDLLVGKGYKSASVVGMPGPSWTARGDTADSQGEAMSQGDKAVRPSMTDTKQGVEALRQKIDLLTNGLIAAAEKSPEQEKFYATPQATAALAKIEALEKEMAEVANRVDTDTRRSIKGLTGTFGLRALNEKSKGKLARFFGR